VIRTAQNNNILQYLEPIIIFLLRRHVILWEIFTCYFHKFPEHFWKYSPKSWSLSAWTFGWFTVCIVYLQLIQYFIVW